MKDREIDRQIAEKVMGWWIDDILGHYYWESNDSDCFTVRLFRDWQPSTNIAHAFEVVEKLHLVADFFLTYHAVDNLWEVDFTTDDGDHLAEAGTPSMAICLAALEAVKEKP